MVLIVIVWGWNRRSLSILQLPQPTRGEHASKWKTTTCLRPVGHVPARFTGGFLALLFCVRFVVQQAVVFADDRQNGAKFLHTDDVAPNHAVTTSHRTLHSIQNHTLLLLTKTRTKIIRWQVRSISNSLYFGQTKTFCLNVP